ncbi:MAG: hypothetical protein Q4D41_04525, partial [Prevotellaceae bacterium]|nr:hypothetical protein [Prevotellaceae bacterium]
MKKFFIIFALILLSMSLSAQDVLITKDGSVLNVYRTDVGGDAVFYTEADNDASPIKKISKDNLLMLKKKDGTQINFYENGEQQAQTQQKQVVEDESVQQENKVPIKAVSSADNSTLIAQYNNDGHSFKDVNPKDKDAKYWHGTIGITESSVLSSDEIQINFSQEEKSYPYASNQYKGSAISGLYNERYLYFCGKYIIEIKNKTSQTIYIDKASSFRIETDGSYAMYYNTQQTTTSQGTSSGGGINLGAVTGVLGIGGVANTLASGTTVGGGKESSVSTSYSDQRIVAIPPYGKMVLSEDEALPIKISALGSDKFKMMSFAEDFNNGKIQNIKVRECKKYTEQDSPLNKKYIITYSMNPEMD